MYLKDSFFRTTDIYYVLQLNMLSTNRDKKMCDVYSKALLVFLLQFLTIPQKFTVKTNSN